ncbi:adenosylcobinamide-GDP ribazoletransferase [Streptomyces heilongjiangensis]|uniref:Adenosylcobinamide-GDP ribazoletransferase n=1 Tax=Streptomyces heilongjiangensis TaxID=945052 RepID=A0ABW1BIM0_9ACTN|nr:adenosylcobinamide-GDP ribazoletransferase [Streptomyces heilongjiangensis]MDC2945950.1 adenosylcobinamide-GDP ribazoletransferase [Streptomyces heilongjiangensis]
MSTPPAPAPTLSDGLRFAFGTLTVLPVRVSRWDRDAARVGMLCAPAAGLVVGGAAAALGGLLLFLGAGPLLAAVAAVAVPAVLTRGLHLDGLADTADGLGSGRPAEDALRIMKQSDIGPFGVIALVLVLFAQVAALTEAYGESWALGTVAAVVSAATARLALTLAARTGVPAARPEGLGAAVAGAVPVRGAVLVAAVVGCAAAGAGALLGPYDLARTVLAVVLGIAAAESLLRHCVRRFGGVTGDVFGGLAETAATAALVVFTLG